MQTRIIVLRKKSNGLMLLIYLSILLKLKYKIEVFGNIDCSLLKKNYFLFGNKDNSIKKKSNELMLLRKIESPSYY